MSVSLRSLARVAVVCASGCLLTAAAPASAQSCQFLAPVGGNGVTDIVTKTIGAGNPLPFSRPNWNTDFFVTQPYSSYKFFFTANSSDPGAQYPVEGFMKFSDGSNLQVINTRMHPPMDPARCLALSQRSPASRRCR